MLAHMENTHFLGFPRGFKIFYKGLNFKKNIKKGVINPLPKLSTKYIPLSHDWLFSYRNIIS